MIYGIGTDIVRVARMQRNVDRYGEKFAQRILTEEELGEYRRTPRPAQFLAKRFAAKEAAAKAMGTGFSNGLCFGHIGVAHDGAGKPLLQFTDYAAEFMAHHRIAQVHLSLSDEAEYAVAFVVLATE